MEPDAVHELIDDFVRTILFDMPPIENMRDLVNGVDGFPRGIDSDRRRTDIDERARAARRPCVPGV
jgi:hypothetical protein